MKSRKTPTRGSQRKTPTRRGQRIAVVGGGIAGMFCAYALAQNGYRVEMFEATCRLGGRIKTVRFGRDGKPMEGAPNALSDLDFHAEFGPMRFELQVQRMLAALLKCLRIEKARDPEARTLKSLEEFPSYVTKPSEHDPKYDLPSGEAGKDALQLLKLAVMRIITRVSIPGDTEFGDRREQLGRSIAQAAALGEDPLLAFDGWARELTATHRWAIQRGGEINGEPLLTMGFWNLVSEHLSHDATLKLQELGSFYHMLPENPNAAEWLAWWLAGFAISDNLVGIAGGTETIVEQLKAELRALKVGINCRCEVTKVTNDGKQARLSFSDSAESQVFDRVILALPRAPLEKIVLASSGEFGDNDLPELIESAFAFPMVKVFILVRKRWWEEEFRANRYASRVPTRELHYWKGNTDGSRRGLIMIYSDRPAWSYWASYVPAGVHIDYHDATTGTRAADCRMRRRIVEYVRANGVDDFQESDIAWLGIRDWGRAPYNGANHAWRPGCEYPGVMARLGRLCLANDAPVHVCGEAYSDYHGFIEGSLRSSVYALSQIMGPSLDWLLESNLRLEETDLKEIRDWVNSLSHLWQRYAKASRSRHA